MSEPVLDQNPASDGDKIAGIAAQTNVDVGGESIERIVQVLRQRFTDAGLIVDDEQVAQLAEDIAGRE